MTEDLDLRALELGGRRTLPLADVDQPQFPCPLTRLAIESIRAEEEIAYIASAVDQLAIGVKQHAACSSWRDQFDSKVAHVCRSKKKRQLDGLDGADA